MSDFAITATTTSRSRGRPPGSGSYAVNDRILYPSVIAMIRPLPLVNHFRDAVKIVTERGKLLAGHGTEHSKMRRFENRFREEVST